VQSAYFYVAGNATAPNGDFYDSEFVFGGQGNGEATTFTQFGASLGLFYGDSVTGAQTAYPSLYSFGANTAEGAYNLHVSYTGNGFSSVSVGNSNYVYLGPASGSYTLPPAGTQTTGSTTSSSAGSTTVTVTSTLLLTTTTISTTTQTVSGPATAVTNTATSTQTVTSTATQTSSSVPAWAYAIMVILLIAGLAVGYAIKRPSVRTSYDP
jgi:thermopsin